MLQNIEQKIRKIRQQFNLTEQAYVEAIFASLPNLKMSGLSQALLIDVLWTCAALKPWIKTLGFQDYLDDLLDTKYGGKIPQISRVLPLITEALLTDAEGNNENLESYFLKRMFLNYQNQTATDEAFGKRWTKIINTVIEELAHEGEYSELWGSSQDNLWQRAISELILEISKSANRGQEIKLAFFIFEQNPQLSIQQLLASSSSLFEMLLSIAEARFLKKSCKNRSFSDIETICTVWLQQAGLIFAESSTPRQLSEWNLSETAYPLIGSRFYQSLMTTGTELSAITNMPEALQVILIHELPKSKFPWLLTQLNGNAQIFSPKAIDSILQLLINLRFATEEIPDILEKLIKESSVPGKKLIAIQYLAQYFPERDWQELSQTALNANDQARLQHKIREIHLRNRLSTFVQNQASLDDTDAMVKMVDSLEQLPHNPGRFQ